VRQPSDSIVPSASQNKEEQQQTSVPNSWELTKGLILHDWQQRCIDARFENRKRGVIKVVTGAGKTILALGIAERLQLDDRELSVAIVVPTTILLHQWRSVLGRHSNLPPTAFGLLGGGHNDELGGGIRVLICVLNSASKKLPAIVEKAGVADTLLLTSSGELTHALSIVLQGTAVISPLTFGDGVRCVGGFLRRLYIHNASNGTLTVPQAGDLSISAESAALFDPIASGSTRYYQVYYRDPDATFCPAPQGNTFNISNGVAVTWAQ